MYDDEEEKTINNNQQNTEPTPDVIEEIIEQSVMENQVSFEDLKIRDEVCQEEKSEIGEVLEGKAEEIIQEKTVDYNEDKKDTYYKESVKCKGHKKSKFKKILAACLVVSVFGGAGIGASYSAMENLVFNKDGNNGISDADAPSLSGTTVSQAQPVSSTVSGSMTAVEVVDAVSTAVVNIHTEVSGTTNYYGYAVPYEGSGSGSGVIFEADAEKVYILTNNHVVDNAKQVNISITGVESIPVKVVGTDSTADMAVLSALRTDFKAAGIADITVAKFGDSDKLKVGESVIAIGNALGEGKSATGGMISILNKNIEIEGLTLNVIQTSAAINSGNSGGALVNYSGEIVGINTAKTSTSVAEAMGYAIPSNTAKEVAAKLLKDGTTPKPYIGIMGADITQEASSMYKLPVGVLVRQVIEGGGAATAGLKENDIIVSFGGKTIMNMESLISVIGTQQVGDTVEMGIIRDAENPMTLNVKILDANAVAAESQQG